MRVLRQNSVRFPNKVILCQLGANTLKSVLYKTAWELFWAIFAFVLIILSNIFIWKQVPYYMNPYYYLNNKGFVRPLGDNRFLVTNPFGDIRISGSKSDVRGGHSSGSLAVRSGSIRVALKEIIDVDTFYLTRESDSLYETIYRDKNYRYSVIQTCGETTILRIEPLF